MRAFNFSRGELNMLDENFEFEMLDIDELFAEPEYNFESTADTYHRLLKEVLEELGHAEEYSEYCKCE